MRFRISAQVVRGRCAALLAVLLAVFVAGASSAQRPDYSDRLIPKSRTPDPGGSVQPVRTADPATLLRGLAFEPVSPASPASLFEGIADLVVCPPGSRTESEFGCGIPNDFTNGGCANPGLQLFTNVSCGERICGTYAYNGFQFDTDWYRLTLVEEVRLTVKVTGSQATRIGYADTSGIDSCALFGGSAFPTDRAEPNETASITICLSPGTHYFVVTPAIDQSPFPCGENYIIEFGVLDPQTGLLDCESCVQGACCTDTGCILTNGTLACESLDGQYQGDGTACFGSTCLPPVNNNCDMASEIACGQTLLADLSLATRQMGESLPSCRAGGGTNSVWFTFIGDGSEVYLSTCDSDQNDIFANDSILAVYQAETCGQVGLISEVACNDQGEGGTCGQFGGLSDVCFQTQAGARYYVQVMAWSDSDKGLYTLSMQCGGCPDPPAGACCVPSGMTSQCQDAVSAGICDALNGSYLGDGTLCADLGSACPAQIPGNDTCQDAEPLAIGAPVQSTTALADGPLFMSCSIPVDTPGLFYTVVGTGNVLTASTCSSGTTFDTKIHVYCDDCSGEDCVAANDDAPFGCDTASEVSWCSADGQTYLLHVTGFDGAQGEFELLVTDEGTPCNNPAPCLESGDCSTGCPPDAVIEGEGFCRANYVDSFNSGCNATPVSFTEITPGQTMCGRSGTYQFQGIAARDIDYLGFEIFQESDVTVTANADFLFRTTITNRSCGNPIVFASEEGAICQPVDFSARLLPGTYFLIMQPQGFSNVDCFFSEWTISLDATPVPDVGACCTDDGCACDVVAQAFCDSIGGVYQGDDSTCAEVECNTCPAEITGDDRVSAEDFFRVIQFFGAGDQGDTNCDGVTDATDFFTVIQFFGSTCP